MKLSFVTTGSIVFVCFVLGASIDHSLASDEAVYNSCKKDLQLSDSGCQCVLDEMHSNLSDHQREVFVELIQGNNAALIAAQSSGKLTAEDMTVLTNFMTTTPSKCQSQ